MPRPLPPLILAYHAVGDTRLADDPHSLYISPRNLRRHIDRVRRWGYRFTTFGAMAAAGGAEGAAGLCALTFDDGFADNLTALLPLLQEERLTGTVFVVPSLLGGRHPDPPKARMLTADEVRELHASGVEIGSHAADHVDLTQMSEPAAQAALLRSREELGALLGEAPTVLAYPFGHADEATRRAAAAAGFVAACRTGDAGSWDDPLDLPRSAMNNTSTLTGLRLKRDGVYEPLMRTVVARAGRSAWRRALVRLG